MLDKIEKTEEKLNNHLVNCVLKNECEKTMSIDRETMNKKLDFILQEIKDLRTEMKEKVEKIMERLDGHDKWRAWMTGAMSVMGLLVFSIIIPLIVYLWQHEKSDTKNFSKIESQINK